MSIALSCPRRKENQESESRKEFVLSPSKNICYLSKNSILVKNYQMHKKEKEKEKAKKKIGFI